MFGHKSISELAKHTRTHLLIISPGVGCFDFQIRLEQHKLGCFPFKNTNKDLSETLCASRVFVTNIFKTYQKFATERSLLI